MTVNIEDFINSNSPADLDVIQTFNIEQVEKLWNSIQIRGITFRVNERDNLIKNKCIEVLEKLYRKPWDEQSNEKAFDSISLIN